MKLPVSLVAYRLATGALAPAAGALLSWRLSHGKEDAARIGERDCMNAGKYTRRITQFDSVICQDCQ